MFNGYVKMALESLRGTKWRSLLTMLGIIVGIVSVVTTVSLGEGIKQQVVGQINRLGDKVITVRPGRLVNRDSKGNITNVNINTSAALNSGSLPADDLTVIKKTKGVGAVAPVSLISGGAKLGNKEYNRGNIIGTAYEMADILKLKLSYGVFFNGEDTERAVAVIGQSVATELFGDDIPIGMAFSMRGQEFIVRGVMELVETPPIALGPDFNKSIMIPYEVGQQMTGGNNQLVQVLVKPKAAQDTDKLIGALDANLKKAHGGQEDFAVLRQDENLYVTDELLKTLTGFIAGIAAISLLVGGIGIMNVMLVAVTERTREIGIRKAIGATNQQILGQFLIEAAVLSLVGGVIGVALSFLTNAALKVATHLHPVITLPIVLIAVGVSLVVGIIFGIMPAAKAAYKDPIEALRYE